MQLPNEDDQQGSNTGIDTTTEEARLSIIAKLPAITITHVNKPTEEEPAVPVTFAAASAAVFSREAGAQSTELLPLVAEDGNRQSQDLTRIRQDSDKKEITHTINASASYEHGSNLKEAMDLPETFDFVCSCIFPSRTITIVSIQFLIIIYLFCFCMRIYLRK